ncbi:leucine-rich repeat protein [Winogradskyella flava]|uniref:Leucine-rich repeat protein n=1 Tax=Winogradskyella flava TaxID=1884876 RepID=A0A842INN4_9FLAO|nr:leucine-rich repeat protein [Winogradskyella flava]MBC2844391.1 leucine-rich repeat protein [Winogradskyella flava]
MKTKLLTLLTFLCITISFAQTFTDNGLDYTITSTNPNEVQITGGTSVSSDLVIPETATDGTDTFTVVSIGNNAFNIANLTSVDLPSTIKSIGDFAFDQNQLTTIDLPEGLETIAQRAFRFNSLTDITIPSTMISIGQSGFGANPLATVIAVGTTPATIGTTTFGSSFNAVDLFIPVGTAQAYTDAGWIGFNSITETACFPPSNLSALNITETSADLTWTENGTAILWDIELLDITNGETATGTPTTTGLNNPSFSAIGLNQDNDYAFLVRADCGTDGVSDWAGPFNFTTFCAAFTAPYSEDFETFTTANNAFTEGNCWSASGGDYFWEAAPGTDTGSSDTGPDPSITTGNYFYTEASAGVAGDITDLVSPLVDLSNLTSPSLTFNYHMFGSDIGTLDVLVNDTDNVFSLSGEQQTSATIGWEFAVIDLSAYAGQTISITFRGTSAGQFEGDIAIDNVAFDELPSCLPPSDLAANNITDLQADLSWTENGTAALWDIELLNITAGETATGIPTASGLTNPSFSATGLTQDNDYAFFVRANCGGDISVWSGPISFKTLETCPRPSNLSASNITDTSADLNWIENDSATLYNIEFLDITAGETATGTPSATGLTTPSFSATGLAPNNQYQFFVQADCDTDGTSAWVGPFSFSTLPTPPECGGIFLDTGGSSGNYSINEFYSTTILPDSPGQFVSITFTYVDIEVSTSGSGQDGCWDFLTIYDGPDNTFPVLAQTLCGEESGSGDVTPVTSSILSVGDTFTSTDPSGALTIVFDSDGSVQETGWEAIVSCATLSIDEFSNSAFTYYPNPVKNTLTLNAKQNIDTVVMYNMLGQNVLSTTPHSLNSKLDMSHLQSGTYFVKVTVNSITKTIRVIKQ